MLNLGDLHIYVSDFGRALRFWKDGMGLSVREEETGDGGAFAVLDFPDGGPALRLFGSATAWTEAERPAPGARPGVSFDVTTPDFEGVLARLLAFGGSMDGEVEVYQGLRTVTVRDPDGTTFELLELPE